MIPSIQQEMYHGPGFVDREYRKPWIQRIMVDGRGANELKLEK